MTALSVVLVLLAGAIIVDRELITAYPQFAPDGHLHASLTLAVNARFCGRSGYISGSSDPTSALMETPATLELPLRRVIVQSYGSMDAYCGTVTVPFVNNENSHQWLMRWYLLLRPDASAADLGRAFSALRLCSIGLLVYALLRIGASIFLATGVCAAGCEVLRLLIPYQYGMYPFIFVAPLWLISLSTLRICRRTPLNLVDCLVGGLVTAFCTNLRTSHTPIYLALVASFLVAMVWRDGVQSRRRRFIVQGVGAFAIGYATFHLAFISPLARPGATSSPNHLIAHPLVLGLAVPDNELARREGIRWDDGVGTTLAKRIDPQVTYLGANYERALFRYYLLLWRRYPGEMLRVYAGKLHVTGMQAIDIAARRFDEVHLHRLGFSWLSARVSGELILAFALAMTIAGFVGYRLGGSLLALTWAQISLVAVLLTIESAMIMPAFYVFYDGALLFYVFLVPVVVMQLLLDFGTRLIARGFALPLHAVERP